MLILDKIEKMAKEEPTALAITSNGEILSYGNLWLWSGLLASHLTKVLPAEEGEKKPVVVYGHKSIYMLVCFLACVRAGRAYCPVDSSMPKERVKNIIQAVDNKLIFATEDIDLEENVEVINLDTIKEIIEAGGASVDESLRVKEDDTYYIIFTSGSTGKPKGVEISTKALTNFTQWSKTLGGEEAEKKGATFLNQAPFSFDLSVMDVYTSLSCGSHIYCLTKAVQKDMKTMLEAIEKGDINYWVSTPSFADMCLADKSFNGELMPNLKAFLFCGEKLTKETASKLMERFPNSKVINTYGPTESTVAVTSVEITREHLEDEKELPIGKCKAGTNIEIDEEEQLLISGDTLSKGYFNNKEKTEEAFFIDKDGIRKYRTGDSGFYCEDMLYYKGRIDFQIKFHGYRIELGDIESNILDIDGVNGCVVIPKMVDGKVKHLVAFVVKEGACGTFAEGKEIKSKLKEKLPEYMVPKKITFLESLPITPNGKADRKKLEAMI